MKQQYIKNRIEKDLYTKKEKVFITIVQLIYISGFISVMVLCLKNLIN